MNYSLLGEQYEATFYMSNKIYNVSFIKDKQMPESSCSRASVYVFYLLIVYLDQRLSPCLITSPFSMRLFKSL